jgi:glutathione peroxidase-family protein
MAYSTSTAAKTRPQANGTDEIKWNFTKFLAQRDGTVIRRYEPNVTPRRSAPTSTRSSRTEPEERSTQVTLSS